MTFLDQKLAWKCTGIEFSRINRKKVTFLDQKSAWKCTGIEFSSHILFIATVEPVLVATCKERLPLLKDQL